MKTEEKAAFLKEEDKKANQDKEQNTPKADSTQA
jgi:hypothetical protein